MAALEFRKDRTAAVLRREAKGAGDARVARRILAIANALDGMSRDEAARSAGMDRQTLRDWVLRYNAHELDGLSDRAVAAAKLRPAGRSTGGHLCERASGQVAHRIRRMNHRNLDVLGDDNGLEARAARTLDGAAHAAKPGVAAPDRGNAVVTAAAADDERHCALVLACDVAQRAVREDVRAFVAEPGIGGQGGIESAARLWCAGTDVFGPDLEPVAPAKQERSGGHSHKPAGGDKRRSQERASLHGDRRADTQGTVNLLRMHSAAAGMPAVGPSPIDARLLSMNEHGDLGMGQHLCRFAAEHERLDAAPAM